MSQLRKAADAAARGQNLQPGTLVPRMEVKTLEGSPASVSTDGNLPTVFYVFSASCHWCEQNLDNVKSLYASASERYRFVGISLDREDPAAVSDYAAKNGLAFPIYYAPSLAALRGYKLGGTPHTIVVSPDGKVITGWAGAYTLETLAEVEQFFAVSLPGIKPMSADAAGQTIH